MRRLGWLIIAGTAAATAVQGFVLDQLLNTMLTPPTAGGDAVLEANGRARAIRFSTLARLCGALHCQPGDLLSYEASAAPAPAAPAPAAAGPRPQGR